MFYMRKINLRSSNKDISVLVTILLILFSFIFLIFPLIFIKIFPQSLLVNYIVSNNYLFYFSFILLLYFVVTGIYYYKLKIDPYIIQMTSHRTIIGNFSNKENIDIPHSMLKKYSFFSRPFSFNKTLMLKIEISKNKYIAKRFNMSILTKKEQNRISKILDQIIEKEKKNG